MEALKDFYIKNQMVVLGCIVALLVLVVVLFMTSEHGFFSFRPQTTYAVPQMPWQAENLALSIPGSSQLDPRFYGSTEGMSVLDSALRGGENFNVLESALKGGENFSEGNDPSETRRTPVLSGLLNPTRMTSTGSAGILNVQRGGGSRRRRPVSNSSLASIRQGTDNDSLATEHMLSRGGAERAIMDASRNRYQGMAKIGAYDYEGYVYEGSGHVYSDEQGELTATVYGVNESPW